MRSLLQYCIPTLMFPVVVISCSRTELQPEEPLNPDAEITFHGAVSLTDDESAKVADFTWVAETDRIGVFAWNGTDDTPFLDNAYFCAMTSSPAAKFITKNDDFVFGWDTGHVYDFCAYYPYRTGYGNPQAIPASLAVEQVCVPENIPDKKDLLLYAYSKGVKQSEGSAELEFHSAYSILEFNISISLTKEINSLKIETIESDEEPLAFTRGHIDITKGTLTAEDGMSNSVTMVPTESSSLSLSSRPKKFYALVTPGHAGKTLRLSADFVKNGEEVLQDFVLPAEGLKASMLYRYESKSEVGGQSIDLSEMGTANTYIINKAATRYCFNATIKGNGIARTYSWTDKGSMRTASYGDADLVITPYDAELVWYNNPLTSEGIPHASPVSLNSVVYEPEKGYIYFETPEDFVEGNAVIAAYDEGGNVLWSWNIWAVEDYDPSADAVRSNGYTFMDRNLGAIRGMEVMDETDDRSAARAIGNYYQWGRKDPFPAAAECKDYDNNWGLPTFTPIVELQQDFSSQSWGSNDMMFGNVLKDNVYAIGRHVGENFTISEAVESGVKYPYKWVTSGPNDGVDENMKWRPDQSYSWMMSGSLADEYVTDWHYLWGNPGADDDRQKSIYDPCPAGWEIPGKDALQVALGKGTTDKPHGALIGGLYFPYAGQRNASFGGSKIVGLADNGISIWCSGFAPDNRVHPYKGFNTGVTVSNSYAGAGYQVRCIRTESNVPVEGGDLTADGGQKEEDWFE